MAEDQVTENVEYMEQATNVFTIVSSATPSVNAELYGALKITGLVDVITGVTVVGSAGSLSEPRDLQQLIVRILDAGVAKAITWGSQFEAVGAALPTVTVAGKRHTVRFLYDATTSKWGAISAVVEA